MSFILLGILNSQAGGAGEHWIASWSAGGTELTIDADDNIYLAGTIDTNDHCLLKIDPFGSLQWDRKLVITDYAQSSVPYKLETDGTYLYTCGFSDNNGNYDNLLTRYQMDGTFDRTRWVGSGSYETASGLAIGASNIYVCGWFPTGDRAGAYKINKDFSSISWFGKANGPNNDFGRDIALDSSENAIYVSQYSTSYTIMKLNSSGARQWERYFSGLGATGGFASITTDSNDNIYVALVSTLTGSASTVVVKFNSSGVRQWARNLTGSLNYPRGIYCDSSDNIFVVGYSPQGGDNDIILAKWDSSGTIQFQRKLHSSNDNYGIRVQTDSTGNIILTAGDSAQSTIVAKLPGDGSGTGTYDLGGVSWTYEVSTLTEGASAASDSAGSFGFSTGYSMTITTPNSSESAASGTLVTTYI